MSNTILSFLCFNIFTTSCAFFLLSNVQLRQNVTKLPQYETYGRSLVLVGGNLMDNNTDIYETIIRLAGGKGAAKIGIINAASADPLGGYRFYRDLFLKYGALEANRVPIDLNHTHNNDEQGTIDLIYRQTGFFFGGGDQLRVIESFVGRNGDFSPALLVLHQMFESGAVIAGTSAGCTCQTANVMIESGVSYDALRLGSFPDSGISHNKYDENVYSSIGGLGFLKGFVLDSHFSQRGREGRMIRLLSDTRALTLGTSRAIGVNENTALVVTFADTNAATGKVIGETGVSIFDLSRSRVLPEHYFHITDVYMSYLTENDVIHLFDLTVTFAAEKSPMAGHEGYDDVLTTSDVFGGASSDRNRKPEFVRLATSIFDARNGRETYGTTYETNPQFRVRLSGNGHDAGGWVERRHSFHSDVTSYKNMHVEILEG